MSDYVQHGFSVFEHAEATRRDVQHGFSVLERAEATRRDVQHGFSPLMLRLQHFVEHVRVFLEE